MPWSENTIMSQREDFVRQVLQRRFTIAELCSEFQISEKTGYKWLARFREFGLPGLADRSHAPRTSPHRISDEVAAELLAIRAAHPTWGPRKLLAFAQARGPSQRWPAASSIGSLLKRHGLVRRRRDRRARSTTRYWGCLPAEQPNDVWSADFKGQFRVASGAYCYPLTVVDSFSRYLLTCTALRSTDGILTRAVFERTFRAYGLPRVLRTDNGVPFASPPSLGQLSTLAVWWIRLGIRPERIEPGKPQQNGRHERMHRTLKLETTKPPASSWRQQQQRFDRFQHCYNEERPHEALGLQPPGRCYSSSNRPYPNRLPTLEYGHGVDVRKVTSIGQFPWRGHLYWLSSVLAGEYVGIEGVEGDRWRVLLGPLNLGYVHPALMTFEPAVFWRASPLYPG